MSLEAEGVGNVTSDPIISAEDADTGVTTQREIALPDVRTGDPNVETVVREEVTVLPAQPKKTTGRKKSTGRKKTTGRTKSTARRKSTGRRKVAVRKSSTGRTATGHRRAVGTRKGTARRAVG